MLPIGSSNMSVSVSLALMVSASWFEVLATAETKFRTEVALIIKSK